ncbi:hypothetical protein OB955_00450 [Halobacteria archaeon AArc-m2/3/4]|uniref:Uncharacterized protein n=1 Tax=Natronoglomus mannanivorans TaxID=2979990 RepID=A0AAP2YYX0_9EURY|nr:hypothetical protein [Halobacteria archaeon AArc-xg1-1]MCU4971208.1 hypothetical protein [Halobacteria archaeon AArc-m2/3/4]
MSRIVKLLVVLVVIALLWKVVGGSSGGDIEDVGEVEYDPVE